jgi:hypothetical protein
VEEWARRDLQELERELAMGWTAVRLGSPRDSWHVDQRRAFDVLSDFDCSGVGLSADVARTVVPRVAFLLAMIAAVR